MSDGLVESLFISYIANEKMKVYVVEVKAPKGSSGGPFTMQDAQDLRKSQRGPGNPLAELLPPTLRQPGGKRNTVFPPELVAVGLGTETTLYKDENCKQAAHIKIGIPGGADAAIDFDLEKYRYFCRWAPFTPRKVKGECEANVECMLNKNDGFLQHEVVCRPDQNGECPRIATDCAVDADSKPGPGGPYRTGYSGEVAVGGTGQKTNSAQ